MQKVNGVLSRGIDIENFWPYWLDGQAPSTVKNSLNLNSLVLLSGPNMAGKS